MEQFNWKQCEANRRKRLAKLIQLEAPLVVIANEAQLIRKAHARTHSDLKMAWRDFLGAIRKQITYAKYDLKHWWCVKVRKQTEDDFCNSL